MIVYIILFSIFFIMLWLGCVESARNRKNRSKLIIRININGIRGKSTATRLITSILHEAGYNTIGKTTGTAARFIIPAKNREEEIKRRPEGPNIKEQIRTIRLAVDYGAEALVCECMAVKPEYQDVYQNKMLCANITVIVNVLEDHLDAMGPTTDEIARAFASTIPYNGYLIVTENQYTDYFRKIAKQRNTQIFVSDNSKIPENYVEQFDYVLFPDNVAIGLAVAKVFGISRNVALKGMLKALPDPGALRIVPLDKNIWSSSVFVNGFAANEPESSLKILEMVNGISGLPDGGTIVLFNGRPDRVDRTQQFVKDFFPKLENVTLIGMGQCIKSIETAMRKKKFPGVNEYIHMEDASPEEVERKLKIFAKNSIIFGVGNIHGDSEELINSILSNKTEELIASIA